MKWYECKRTDKMRVQIVVDEVKVLDYLASTDWYAIREAETGVDIPQDVLDKRALCRTLI